MTNLLDKERRDWKIKQAEMVRQVADLQEECRSVTGYKNFTQLRLKFDWIITFIILHGIDLILLI